VRERVSAVVPTGLSDRPSGHRPDASAVGQGRFAGSGVVGRYWQARCRGFEVRSTRGRRLGTVQSLELDRDTAAAAVLVVRRRHRRPLRVRPELVSLVDPWQRSLVVSLPRHRKVPAWPGTAARGVARVTLTSGRGGAKLVRGARRIGPPARRATVLAASRVSDSRRLVPPARRGLLGLGRRAVLAAALVVWFYALLVFTLVRVVLAMLRAAAAGTARGGARLRPLLHGAAGRSVPHL